MFAGHRLLLLNVASLSLVIFLSSCGFPPSKLKAATTLHCDQKQIVIDDTYNSPQPATGCGRTDVMVYKQEGWTSFRERLIFELSCPDADIDIKILTLTDYGVTGCGKKLVYKFVPRVGIVADTMQGMDPGSPKAAGSN
jgi:hypothetical protein